MPHPPEGWFDALPRGRCLAELSLWSARLSALSDDIARTEAGTDLYHIDVSDGHFTPGLLFFPDLVAAVRAATARPLHVHLMVEDAILPAQIEQFAAAGADLISIHAENSRAVEALSLIRSLNIRAGIVLKLESAVSLAAPFIGDIDMLTLLGTRIGVKGQSLSPLAGERLRQACALRADAGDPSRLLIAADGGIREDTVPALRAAGADTVVLGSLGFGAEDFNGRIDWLHALKKD